MSRLYSERCAYPECVASSELRDHRVPIWYCSEHGGDPEPQLPQGEGEPMGTARESVERIWEAVYAAAFVAIAQRMADGQYLVNVVGRNAMDIAGDAASIADEATACAEKVSAGKGER